MARNVDFDAAWDVLAGTQAAPKMTVYGEEITLPVEQPLALILLRQQLVDPEQRRHVTIERVLKALGLAFGDDIVNRWVDEKAIGMEKLALLVITVGSAWLPDPQPEEGDGEGEAQPPETGDSDGSSPTSSTAGPTS